MLLQTGQYFGSATQKLETAGMIVTQSSYDINIDIPLHYHQNPHFCYFIKGGCSEFVHKQEFPCLPGDLVVHPHQIEHKNHYYNDVTKLLHIEFDPFCYKKLNENGIHFNQFRQLKHQTIKNVFQKIYDEYKQPDTFSRLIVEGLVYELLVDISIPDRKEKNIPCKIKRIIEIMHDHYQEPIGLAWLASSIDIQPEHLARKFKKTTGTTVGEYLRKIRVEKACSLLKNTRDDILSVALDCGFSDQSHFTQVFVKITGITPARYRKRSEE
jgi:AraC family transcriptional regulator